MQDPSATRQEGRRPRQRVMAPSCWLQCSPGSTGWQEKPEDQDGQELTSNTAGF